MIRLASCAELLVWFFGIYTQKNDKQCICSVLLYCCRKKYATSVEFSSSLHFFKDLPEYQLEDEEASTEAEDFF